MALRDKLEGQDFLDMNQVLQRAMVQENRAKEHMAYGWFKKVSGKDKAMVNCMDEDTESEVDARVCVAEWVDTAKTKPLACSFLKPSPRKKDEMKFMFNVSKCDKLFDVLLQNNIIRLSDGHVVTTPGQLAKGKYCKWHGTFSHTTNECNYFRWHVQSALNDGRLTLGDSGRMRLDTEPFPMNVNVINFGDKRVLVSTSQADMTRGKKCDRVGWTQSEDGEAMKRRAWSVEG
jgi:hypothetical protein